jgi:hypothetical protein
MKGEIYRLARDWHGYLSALAFLALIFFAGTGILLNHPGLLQGEAPAAVETTFMLSADEIAAVRAATEPGRKLAQIAGDRAELAGAYRAGDLAGDDLYVNLQGVRGRSDVTGNLATGDVTVHVEKADAVGIANELHRGEHAGDAWRLLIDAIAIVLMAMSVIGLVLFFSLRFRLKTALVLIAGSAIIMGGLFVFAVS